MIAYVTFGMDHYHEIGEETFTESFVAMFACEDEADGRYRARKVFGSDWDGIFFDAPPDMDFYSGGLKNVDVETAISDKKVDRRTNIEFVTDIMNFHASGGLAQSFVIEALRFYCKLQVEQDVDELAKLDDESNPMISRVMWRAIGVDIHNSLEKKYNYGEPKEHSAEDSSGDT